MTVPDETPRQVSRETGEPHRLEPGGFYVVDTTHGFRNVDLTSLKPTHKTGHPVFSDVASFVHYFDKHADKDSEVFVDEPAHRIIAVLDAHTENEGARWQQHTATLLVDGPDLADAVRQFTLATGAVVMYGTPGS